MKPTYVEQLKHPNWQRKRLEILEREEFMCEECENADLTLHVHHGYYEKGLSPWEYPDESLHVLCEDCHKKAQRQLTLLHRQIGKLDMTDIEQLSAYALALEAQAEGGTVIWVESYEIAQGVGDAFQIRPEAVIDARDREHNTIDGRALQQLRASARSGRLEKRGA
jgi:hypothetical protein